MHVSVGIIFKTGFDVANLCSFISRIVNKLTTLVIKAAKAVANVQVSRYAADPQRLPF